MAEDKDDLQRHRPEPAQGRRPRQGGGPDPVRRRPRPPAHAVRAAAPLAAPARAHPEHRRRARPPRTPASPPRSSAPSCRSRSASCPSARTSTRCALDKVRFVGDPVAAVAAIDEETAEEALKLIDVEYEVLPPLMSIDEALARPDARIHDYGPRGNVHKEVSLRLRQRRGGIRGGGPHPGGHLLLRGQHPPADGAALGAGRLRPGRQAHAVVGDADAALRPPRGGQGAGDGARPRARHRLPERRRVRRQERSLQPRARGLQALDEDGPAGEDHAEPRGGLLLPPRPPPGADVGEDRPQEGRLASPRCTSAPRSTAAGTAATAWPASTTRARCRP